MNTVAVIQARMQSTRLPGKVLADLGGHPVLSWVVSACARAYGIEKVIVATSTEKADDKIEKWCKYEGGVACIRGSENDVLSRFVLAATVTSADTVIRLTADCPFLDSSVIEQVIHLQSVTGADYASCTDPPTFPDGLDTECFTVDALRIADKEATSKIDRDCVTSFIYRNQHRFKCETLICPLPGLHKERWVLDCADDYEFCKQVAGRLNGHPPSYFRILDILNAEPHLRDLNRQHPRNERFYEAIANEPLGTTRDFANSRRLLARAKKTIPLGTQTFSKSEIQYPQDCPLFISHGDGGYCFDVDGNRYVDLVGGLLPVILGHRDPDVDWAIRSQLNRGISFSLATELEAELSEMLCRLIPCAEMVRLGKNGTDVTTAAVRLARAYTGRDVVVSSGYHGWADWTVAHDRVRNAGVPQVVRDKTIALRHGDGDGLRSLRERGDIAAVVVEPETDPEFLRVCRDFCDQTGALLVFDEIITWPRWGLGGAQEAFGVTSDLTCIGKAMANGMPISALVGRRKFMSAMDKISYSGTFFGETLSIAAAIATIRKLEAEDVVAEIQVAGRSLHSAVDRMVASADVPIGISSGGGLGRLSFRSAENADAETVKTYFMQEMAMSGTLIIATHNLSYAHGPNEIKRVLRSYEHTLGALGEALRKGDIRQRIRGRPIPAHANVRAAV